MKICIDARSPGYAGVLNYTSCFLKSLVDIDTKNSYIILTTFKDKQWNLPGAKEIVIPYANPVGWTVWSNTKLSKMLASEKVDIYHSLKHVSYFKGKPKKIITFHSARLFLHPFQYKLYEFIYWRMMYPFAAKKYDCIIAVSEAEKRNYLNFINVDEKKFKVIHLAADSRFRIINDTDKLQEIKKKFALPDRFLLFVGRIHPVKNLDKIIKAFYIAQKGKNIGHKLVIVGKKTEYYNKLASLINELQIKNEVVFTGPVFDELPYIYNLADLFVFTSLYEGFPAVPLEAMACGTPVIASNVGGLPEVVGDAAYIVPQGDWKCLANAITKVLSSNSAMELMRGKGIERSKKFSWDRHAKTTIDVYEELAEK